ncbi:MAG: hypothetical protein HOW73_29030 [Polyangiaceae bacterium]|nr:hypothetical protein [Polyangiaceae bacterium]
MILVSVMLERCFSFLFIVVLVLGFGASGCSCARKSDEEILKERIDTTSVHLYLAAKLAILKADQSPDAKVARDHLLEAAAAARDGRFDLSAAEDWKRLVDLAQALWKLREDGQRMLESGEDNEPILPALLGATEKEALPPALKELDKNLEHGLLLLTMFTLKFHPSSPVPIPEEVMLYESWMTDASNLKVVGIGHFMHAIKAVVYGQNELCDLSKKEAAKAGESDAAPAELKEALRALTGNEIATSDAESKEAFAAARAVAHGMAGLCYMKRKEKPKALDELEKFCEAAEEAGLPGHETAVVRAAIAIEKGDKEKAKKALDDLDANPDADPASKERAAELRKQLDDDGIGAEYLTKADLGTLVVATLAKRSSILADAFGSTAAGQKLKSFSGATSGAVEAAKKEIPSYEDVKKTGVQFWKRWF